MIVESVHGTLRRLFLEPAVGDLRARQVSVFTGIALIFAVTFFCIRWIRARTVSELLLIGLLWVLLTLTFEIVLGRMVLDYEWDRIVEDYDVRRGGLMGFGLLFMFFAPLLAARLLGIDAKGYSE
jgi:hypothetical protein